MEAPSAVGSPGSMAWNDSVSFATKSSKRPSTTTNRFAALHAWPALSRRAAAAASTTESRSSVESRMNGSEPPSSSTTFLRLRPAISATAAPARSEPVTETPWTRGSAIAVATCSFEA